MSGTVPRWLAILTLAAGCLAIAGPQALGRIALWAGLPVLTLNTGLTEGGIPLGVQIVAPRFREDVAFDAAAAIEARGEVAPIAMAG